MKNILRVLCLLASCSAFSQFNFQREISLPINTTQWFVDPVGNHYLLAGNKLTKIDSLGEVKFSQAIKSQGEINQLVFNSAQKIISFSEEQQQICLFDNTITPVSTCLSLEEYGIINATCIASSRRANSVWIYDCVNSTLSLFDIDKKMIQQQLKNIKGLIEFGGNTTYFKEDDEKLWISDGSNTFGFDLNLNLTDKFDFSCTDKQFIENQTYFEFVDDAFFVLNLSSKEQGIGENPVPNATQITFVNGYFYFKKGSKIYVYKIA
jgi:hypothetical protein